MRFINSTLNLQMELAQLLRIHVGRRAGHEVDGVGGLGKRDDFADRALSGQDCDDPVETERDAAVRRRAVLERVQEESKTVVRVGLAIAEPPEDAGLELLVMNSNAPAANLGPIQ